jgi:hypothetical protein
VNRFCSLLADQDRKSTSLLKGIGPLGDGGELGLAVVHLRAAAEKHHAKLLEDDLQFHELRLAIVERLLQLGKSGNSPQFPSPVSRDDRSDAALKGDATGS